MLNVSDAYKTAIRADVELVSYRDEFGFVPPGAREGAAVTSQRFDFLPGRDSQIKDGQLAMGGRWATAERNRNVLGVAWDFVDLTQTQKTGIWSSGLSSSDGAFPLPYPQIDYVLDKPYDLVGIQVYFDDQGEEWAAALTVAYLNASNGIIAQTPVSGDGPTLTLDMQGIGVKSIRITIQQWNLPGRRAKVAQVLPGQVIRLTENDIYSFSLSEQIAYFSKTPFPETVRVIPNEGNKYNIVNPVGVTSKLRQMMTISHELGLMTGSGYEYVSAGAFYLHSWPDKADENTAEFACRPSLAFAGTMYPEGLTGTQTVEQAAQLIKSTAGIDEEITVADALKNITVNRNIGAKVPLHDALCQLATAAGGYLKFERGGSYSIRAWGSSNTIKTLSYERDIWKKPKITQNQPLSGVTVEYFPAGNSESVFVSAESELGRTETVSSNFIPTLARAQAIGALAIQFFSRRLQYEIVYRGDAALEPGDDISVETDFGFRTVRVTKSEITYSAGDYLQGKLWGVEID